ncbi:AI-2E family transporter [Sphingomonas pokkalii]|uniref:AI-2E family transporter n=1 Tax=Sphingomonas pokkalii TaxID=2175090 RepID=A0A2U0SJI3_9SPHN|nr:AI-2E family transporter [Sphingomonas pokkalii]PVX31511.1 AI-2E family transporter [Sphingomonas pokkalii]
MKRLVPDDADARFIRRVLILLALGGVVVALVRAADLLILTFGAVLGAVVIRAIGDRYLQLGLARRWSVPAAMATVLAAIAFLVWLFAVQFGPQIEALVRSIPQLVARLEGWAQRSPVTAKLYDAAEAAFAGSRVARDAGGFALGSAELLLNTLLLLVGALFIAADPGVYLRGALLLVPKGRQRDAVADALADVGTTLRLWLRTQIILMTSMGLLVGLGLWIAGVPSPAALGLLAGLSEFIPYVGPTAAMLPALGLAATAGTGTLIGCLLTFAGVRIIQTNFLTPFVQSRVIAIPPAVTLFAIIGIGFVFGLFGLFFSAALLVVIFTLVRSVYLREVLGEEIDPRQPPDLPSEPPPSEPAS